MNHSVFTTARGAFVPPSDTTNEAGGKAYHMSAEEALAQFAVTSCFNDTFYVSAEEQVDKVLKLCDAVSPEFVAKTAIHARQRGYMKDMPALLLAYLSKRDVTMFQRIFLKVADDARMVKRVAHIIRSGVIGRKSFGTGVRRMFRDWFWSQSAEQLFKSSVGGDVPLADLIKMIHPRPRTEQQSALYAYLIGKKVENTELLPELVRQFEAFKAGKTTEVPPVPFLMLTGLNLGKEAWTAIARTCSWTSTRMNLNTFARHGVFDSPEMVRLVAEKLANKELVKRSRVFPYQLLTAYLATNDVPVEIRNALQDAMEVATENVPKVDGKVVVCVDVSGSMDSPVTGARKGATTATSCRNVAALIAAVFMRMNTTTHVIPFTTQAFKVEPPLNPRDSVMTNASILSRLPSGGTACSVPMAVMNAEKREADLIIYASDNESWYDSGGAFRMHYSSLAHESPPLAKEWSIFKARCPKARMVCIDLAPNESRQADERVDTLNIGGFSDSVFDVIADFAKGGLGRGRVVADINNVVI